MKPILYIFDAVKRRFLPHLHLIKSQKQLLKICEKINSVNQISVDTEFMREKTYYPLLCLIQINVAGKCYIIDALAKEIDLDPFLKILQNDKIEKIFHCSYQDLEVLTHNFKKTPKTIIDTQIMANFCGFDYNISYAKLVKILLNKNLDKEWQRSDWQKRPLHKPQIRYALIDVLYLPKIHQILADKLEKLGRTKWLIEEMKTLSGKKSYDMETPDLYKKFSLENRGLTYQENVKLLAIWRDNLARKRNVPRSFVLKDDLLAKIAAANPQSFEELEQIFRKNKFIPANIKKEIFAVLQNRPEISGPETSETKKTNFRLTSKQDKLFQKARQLLQKKSKKYNLKAQFIINQNDLKHIVLGNKKIADLLSGWRHEVLGQDLDKIISDNEL